MNANKQDAGGLLPDELEAAIQDVADHANSDGDFVSNETERATENLRMKIRAYGELCRAAPAGGDEPDVLHPQYRHGFESGMKFEGEHGLMTTNAPKRDSAPAGGDVKPSEPQPPPGHRWLDPEIDMLTVEEARRLRREP